MSDLQPVKSIASKGRISDKVGGLWALFIISFVVNVLFLTGPIFMMQVYDRFLPTGNMATLFGLFAIAVIMYVAFGAFDVFRLQISALRGEAIAEKYGDKAFEKAMLASALGRKGAATHAPEDVETIRSYLTSPSLMALFDLPSIPLFFIAVTLLHPVLGLTVISAGIVLGLLAIWNERSSRTTMEPGRQKALQASQILTESRADSVSLLGNGMTQAAAEYWKREDQQARGPILDGTRLLATFGSVTKTLRMIIQSIVLAVGGWLVVEGQLTAGAMIAASIVFARAIAPIEQTLNSYRQLLSARSAWQRIKLWRDEVEMTEEKFELPHPCKAVDATQIAVSSPETGEDILKNVSFALVPNDVLGVVGPSGSGKSSLVKALVGAWPIESGRLAFDNADLAQWSLSEKSEFIGYLGQSVSLVDASFAENIARLKSNYRPEDVITAAKVAGVHDLILSMPEGYQTRVGMGGVRLSGGQRQRIGLARALYGNPFLLVLDEPTAHLDPDGKTALIQVLHRRRAEGKITIITSHDDSILRHVTKLVVLEKGLMKISGPKAAVSAQLRQVEKNLNAKTSSPMPTTSSKVREPVK